MSIAVEIQKSIYSKLSVGLSVPVFDAVPDNQPKPYVVIGDDTITEFDQDGVIGFDCTITLHVWSDYNGRAEVKTLQGQCFNLLNRAELTVTGYNLLGCNHEFSDSFLETNGVTRHGVQRYRLLLTSQ